MLLFPSWFLLPISVNSQNYGRVEVGSSLTASTGDSSSWLSPSGDFAFGFSPLGNNDRFLLSIWYAKIPDKTVVWYAYDGDNPMVAPRGSVLNLTANGLVLNNPQGVEIWKSEITSGIVENGVMHDTGNFVLQNKNSGSLWKTFSNPTDTVLPGQTIEKKGNLTCRQSETNYTKGRFQLRLQDDGNLVLYNGNIPYFSTRTTAGTVPGSPGKQLVFDSSGEMFLRRENGGIVPINGTQGVSARDNYIRATLDFDGIFALYSHPKSFTGNAGWSSPLWYMPYVHICRKLGEDRSVCGDNSVCKLKPENRPTCECCKKVRKDNATPQSPPKPIQDDKGKSRKSVMLVESVLLASSIFVIAVFVIAVLVSALCLRFLFIFRKKIARRSTDIVLDSNLCSFTYEELQKATKGFVEELGRGAFGVVFKGEMQIGSRSGVKVAVKKLNCVRDLSADVEEQFKTEVNVIGQTHHKNLVRLFGYCVEGQERLLVYEFLSNGTLASFLFSGIKRSWRQRIEIARGIARGLLYLHEECRTQIVHCDIKPQNILLDDNYIPQISDFGLAKLLLMNQIQIPSATRGTQGYVAPERFRDAPITTEVDVYSFGVVLLEIICCKTRFDMEHNYAECTNFTNWIYDCYIKRVLDDFVDHEVEALGDRTTLEKFVMVAIWCIQEDPALRHPMRKVVEMLKGDVEVPTPPRPLPYITE